MASFYNLPAMIFAIAVATVSTSGAAWTQREDHGSEAFATALSANIYDLRWTKSEWSLDGGSSFYRDAPIWLVQLREHFPQAKIDYLISERLAVKAYESARERNSRGLCMAGFADALVSTFGAIVNFYKLPTDRDLLQQHHQHTLIAEQLLGHKRMKTFNGAQSAAAFWQWTEENPRQLCETFGMMRVQNIHHGFVAIYAPGECGFHDQFGHIEVIVGNQGCSDHCRPLRPSCQPSTILAPVASCSSFADSEPA
jgi:hypothetical protein